MLSQLVSSCALACTNSENSHPKSFTQLTHSGVFCSDILEFLGDILCVTLPNSQSTEQPSSRHHAVQYSRDTLEALLEQLRSSTTQARLWQNLSSAAFLYCPCNPGFSGSHMTLAPYPPDWWRVTCLLDRCLSRSISKEMSFLL